MNTTSTIVKNLIVPLVIKFSKGDVASLTDDFWYQFATDFIHYEIDATPIYKSLYKLELQNPEDVFEKLPQAYSNFINELAEEYVLGYQSEITTKLLESKNETFLKEVVFLNTMKSVIIKTERNQLKKDLLLSYDRLVFELDEETLRQVAKKKSREDLRAKFEQWDEEFVKEESNSEVVRYSIIRESNSSFNNEKTIIDSNPKRKVILLSWMKYAAAACLVLGLGVWFYNNQKQGFVHENNVYTAPGKTDTPSNNNINPEIPSEVLAEVTSVIQNTSVIETGLGFAQAVKKIKIVENNQKARMQSIIIANDKYRKILEKESNERPMGNIARVIQIEKTINYLQNELALLKERENHYVFDGKALVMYVLKAEKENPIILYKEIYYLKRDTDFYRLNVATQPQNFIKETDLELIEKLNLLLLE